MITVTKRSDIASTIETYAWYVVYSAQVRRMAGNIEYDAVLARKQTYREALDQVTPEHERWRINKLQTMLVEAVGTSKRSFKDIAKEKSYDAAVKDLTAIIERHMMGLVRLPHSIYRSGNPGARGYWSRFLRGDLLPLNDERNE